jgi:hypothetical protein
MNTNTFFTNIMLIAIFEALVGYNFWVCWGLTSLACGTCAWEFCYKKYGKRRQRDERVH